MLVGGYAVGFHGYARATGDIDVWVRQSPGNAARLVTALRAFGFDVPDLAPSLLLVDGRIVRMGLPPNRVEVMTSVSGLTFESAWERRETSDWDGLAVPVLGLSDLRANKAATPKGQRQLAAGRKTSQI